MVSRKCIGSAIVCQMKERAHRTVWTLFRSSAPTAPSLTLDTISRIQQKLPPRLLRPHNRSLDFPAFIVEHRPSPSVPRIPLARLPQIPSFPAPPLRWRHPPPAFSSLHS